MDEFKDAIRLLFDENNVARYNYERLKKLRNPIARISAVHSGTAAVAATSDDAGRLQSDVFLGKKKQCDSWYSSRTPVSSI